jgi:Fe-S cluster biogenesis protein NfuA
MTDDEYQFVCPADDGGNGGSCRGCRVEGCSLRAIPIRLDDLIDRLEAESKRFPEKWQDRAPLVNAISMLNVMIRIHYIESGVGEPRDYQNEREMLSRFVDELEAQINAYFEEEGGDLR